MASLSEKTPLIASRPRENPNKDARYVLVIHGGAGTMSREGSTPEAIKEYHAALKAALLKGHAVLKEGGEAMDAVVAAVTSMEDNPLFNAGKGAVFNIEGKNELETSLMLSKPPSTHPSIPATRRGIGITLLTRIKNPSQLARLLYLNPERVPHTFVSGAPAERIGESLGAKIVNPSYFFTSKRWKEHIRGLGLPEDEPPVHDPADNDPFLDGLPQGTVGAVALDIRGCIAALTSTGGKTNKLAGRIGDTPTMGTGFWAEEWAVQGWWRKRWRRWHRKTERKAVGVSGTGDGDYYIRHATASAIANRMKFLNQSVAKASQAEIDALFQDGGIGGVIALDREGNVAMPMNSTGMYRGVILQDGLPKTAIFSDDVLS